VDLGAGDDELTLLAQGALQVLTLHVVGQNKPPGDSMVKKCLLKRQDSTL
jgi:hypothetical protein